MSCWAWWCGRRAGTQKQIHTHTHAHTHRHAQTKSSHTHTPTQHVHTGRPKRILRTWKSFAWGGGHVGDTKYGILSEAKEKPLQQTHTHGRLYETSRKVKKFAQELAAKTATPEPRPPAQPWGMQVLPTSLCVSCKPSISLSMSSVHVSVSTTKWCRWIMSSKAAILAAAAGSGRPLMLWICRFRLWAPGQLTLAPCWAVAHQAGVACPPTCRPERERLC